MSKVLFIWNYTGKEGNIGSYRPSVYAAKKLGYDIDIAMNFKDTPIEKRREIETTYGIRLISFDIDRNPYSLNNYKAFKQLVKIMQDGDYDIIHCNTPMGGILGRLAANKVKNRKVFYMNRGFAFYKGGPLKNWMLYYPVEKIFARLYTDAIATINPIDFSIAKRFRLRNNSKLKFSLPGPGVELARFEFNEEQRRIIRSKYNIAETDVLIVAIGELSERKNLVSIIEALGILKKDRTTSSLLEHVYFMMVGTGDTEDLLKRRARELGISESLIFAGFHEDVENYYSASDIFVLPSLSEGFGRVGIEAMSVGLPIITSDAQGINLYSIDGETGFKCKANDYNAFARAIKKMVSDEPFRKDIGKHNKEFSRNFSMENTGDKIADIYSQLMRKNDVGENRNKTKSLFALISALIAVSSGFIIVKALTNK